MKQFLFIIAIGFMSCSHKTDYNANPSKPQCPFLGKWAYAEDESRYFTVDSVDDTHAYITFPKPIDAPPFVKGPVSLIYDLVSKNDTTFCTIPSIYPCCYFYSKGTNGAAVEYLKDSTQGKYKPLIQLK
jgi:hypothetical protein